MKRYTSCALASSGARGATGGAAGRAGATGTTGATCVGTGATGPVTFHSTSIGININAALNTANPAVMSAAYKSTLTVYSYLAQNVTGVCGR